MKIAILLILLIILTTSSFADTTGLASGIQPIPKSCRPVQPSYQCLPPQTILTRGRQTFCCEPTGVIQPTKKTPTPPSTLKQTSTTTKKTKLTGKTIWTPAGLIITGQTGLNQPCGLGKQQLPCSGELKCLSPTGIPFQKPGPPQKFTCQKQPEQQPQTICPPSFREVKQTPLAIQNVQKGLPHIRQGWLTAVCQTKNEQHKILPDKNTICCYGTPCPKPPQDCALQTDTRCPTHRPTKTIGTCTYCCSPTTTPACPPPPSDKCKPQIGTRCPSNAVISSIGKCNYCCTPRPTIQSSTPTQQQIIKDRVQQLIALGNMRVVGAPTPQQPTTQTKVGTFIQATSLLQNTNRFPQQLPKTQP